MKFNIEYELEDDGRWIAEIATIPGALVYGATKEAAAKKVISIALKAMADQIN